MDLSTEESLKTYRELVEELLSDTPDEKKIKRLMCSLGLKYSTQNVDRLTEVLAFHPTTQRTIHDLQ